MRHHLSGRQLSRNSAHRKALLRNMAAALLREGTIRTTLPKAKELRRVVEPLITLGRNESLAGRRRAQAQLRDAALVDKLFGDIGPRFRARAGGYTRILKMEPRAGDAAPMALMQLIEAEVAASPAVEAKPARRAQRRVAAGKTDGGEPATKTQRRRRKIAA